MQKIYIDTSTGSFYNGVGELFANGYPQIAYKSEEEYYIQLCTESPDAETPGSRPDLWHKDKSLDIPGVSAFLSVDSDFRRRHKGTLSLDIAAGSVEEISVDLAVQNTWDIRNTGVVRLFRNDGTHQNFRYKSFIKSGSKFIFSLESGLSVSEEFPAGTVVDVPDSLFIQSVMDYDKSDPANGLFVFKMFADSPKLRETMEYSDLNTLSSLSGMEFLPFVITAENTIIEKQSYLCRTCSITGTVAEADLDSYVPDVEEISLFASISSILGRGMETEFSADGTSWHTGQKSDDLFYRYRLEGSAPNTPWTVVKMFEGKPGEDGKDGVDGKNTLVQYSVNGTVWTTTPEDAAYIRFSTDDGATWQEGFRIKGTTGTPAGFGTPTASTASVSSDSPAKVKIFSSGPDTAKVFEFEFEIPQGKQGEKGDRGAAFKIDAAGTLDERSQYDSQPKGFSFLATDNGNVYIKQSDSSGDWSDASPFKGDKGDTGAVFTPAVDEKGNISWSNNGNLANPTTVNIKGDKGETGSVENLRLEITSVENGAFLVENDNFFPVAVLTASGKCYPLEKESLHKAETGWRIDIAKYLAYDNVAEFTAPWYVYCAGGVKGEDGWSFNPDARGFASEKSNYDNEPKGFAFLAFDEGNIYFKNSDTAGDWSDAVPFRGEQGEQGLRGIPGENGPPGPMADIQIGDNGNWIVNGVDTGKKATGAGSNVVVSPTPPSTVYNGLIWIQSNNAQHLNIDPISVVTSNTEPSDVPDGTIWIESEV